MAGVVVSGAGVTPAEQRIRQDMAEIERMDALRRSIVVPDVRKEQREYEEAAYAYRTRRIGKDKLLKEQREYEEARAAEQRVRSISEGIDALKTRVLAQQARIPLQEVDAELRYARSGGASQADIDKLLEMKSAAGKVMRAEVGMIPAKRAARERVEAVKAERRERFDLNEEFFGANPDVVVKAEDAPMRVVRVGSGTSEEEFRDYLMGKLAAADKKEFVVPAGSGSGVKAQATPVLGGVVSVDDTSIRGRAGMLWSNVKEKARSLWGLAEDRAPVVTGSLKMMADVVDPNPVSTRGGAKDMRKAVAQYDEVLKNTLGAGIGYVGARVVPEKYRKLSPELEQQRMADIVSEDARREVGFMTAADIKREVGTIDVLDPRVTAAAQRKYFAGSAAEKAARGMGAAEAELKGFEVEMRDAERQLVAVSNTLSMRERQLGGAETDVAALGAALVRGDVSKDQYLRGYDDYAKVYDAYVSDVQRAKRFGSALESVGGARQSEVARKVALVERDVQLGFEKDVSAISARAEMRLQPSLTGQKEGLASAVTVDRKTGEMKVVRSKKVAGLDFTAGVNPAFEELREGVRSELGVSKGERFMAQMVFPVIKSFDPMYITPAGGYYFAGREALSGGEGLRGLAQRVVVNPKAGLAELGVVAGVYTVAGAAARPGNIYRGLEKFNDSVVRTRDFVVAKSYEIRLNKKLKGALVSADAVKDVVPVSKDLSVELLVRPVERVEALGVKKVGGGEARELGALAFIKGEGVLVDPSQLPKYDAIKLSLDRKQAGIIPAGGTAGPGLIGLDQVAKESALIFERSDKPVVFVEPRSFEKLVTEKGISLDVAGEGYSVVYFKDGLMKGASKYPAKGAGVVVTKVSGFVEGVGFEEVSGFSQRGGRGPGLKRIAEMPGVVEGFEKVSLMGKASYTDVFESGGSRTALFVWDKATAENPFLVVERAGKKKVDGFSRAMKEWKADKVEGAGDVGVRKGGDVFIDIPQRDGTVLQQRMRQVQRQRPKLVVLEKAKVKAKVKGAQRAESLGAVGSRAEAMSALGAVLGGQKRKVRSVFAQESMSARARTAQAQFMEGRAGQRSAAGQRGGSGLKFRPGMSVLGVAALQSALGRQGQRSGLDALLGQQMRSGQRQRVGSVAAQVLRSDMKSQLKQVQVPGLDVPRFLGREFDVNKPKPEKFKFRFKLSDGDKRVGRLGGRDVFKDYFERQFEVAGVDKLL